ncbi:hypothetical protein TVAG_110340 [Trichomonas vaginalis G3]|uniref:Polycystin cation channel PKD1/PKD2 domain-containing protein n=1 Tax=Trichomonas vaginalis (strain ATCC PRA-98 / G3) TaxID=412133 RepID=A2DGN5_TRIV3|nr:hypothetical protein TVAGG3_0997720 [Trichomonas vaginalis G3]EAY20422.1 hypothetical protein TVAG_110340 [Trichomonas vaginalis G3]KAI5490528.1 hypothetical protein TVAGG3_0997720 [Trichomonas vaginalis G3]|eukprot:XP_001581408.1 hypothetical protein [Trichomonas vaginalis G3]
MQLYLVNEYDPYRFEVDWKNGTSNSYLDFDIHLGTFHHISTFKLSTDFYSVSPHSSIPGCTKWHVASIIMPNDGSYTYTSAPIVTRDRCPETFMEIITEKPKSSTSSYRSITSTPNPNRKYLYRNEEKKSASFIKSNSKSTTPSIKRTTRSRSLSMHRKITADFPSDLLPNTQIPQSLILQRNTISLCVLSFIGTVYLAIYFYRHIKQHNQWHSTDSIYKDLTLYDQLHFSLGFWNPLHLLTEALLFSCSIFCLIQSQRMTQYPSYQMLIYFAFAFLSTYVVACRWFIYTPRLYQLIRIIRVVMMQIITIIIGLSPLVVGLMFFGSFFFGFVSDISRSFFRFFQMFVGATFGDDLFFMFTYYTDGTDLFNLLALIYVTAVAIVAGYICFPSFTSTISVLHKTVVIPVEEREKLEKAEE